MHRADAAWMQRAAALQSELPAGLRVVRVRGGAATVAATGGQYTARLTLVPSPRDDVTLAKYRPPGEPEEVAAGGPLVSWAVHGCTSFERDVVPSLATLVGRRFVARLLLPGGDNPQPASCSAVRSAPHLLAAAVKEEPEVTQPVAGPSTAAPADAGQPSSSATAAGPSSQPRGRSEADQRQGTDCWRWQLLSFELLPAAAGLDPPPLLAPQQQWLQQHVEQRMWVAADVEQLVRLGKQAWVTVPAPPKEQQEQGRAFSGPAPTASMAPSQLPAVADSKGKQPMAVDEPEVPAAEQQGAAAAQLPAYTASPLAAMHAVLCQSAGRLALFSLLLSDARRLEGGSWKGCLKLSRASAGAGIR